VIQKQRQCRIRNAKYIGVYAPTPSLSLSPPLSLALCIFSLFLKPKTKGSVVVVVSNVIVIAIICFVALFVFRVAAALFQLT